MMETGSVEHDDEADGDSPSSVDGLHRYLSPRGLARFRAEQAALRHGERPRIVEIVSWAAGNGDRSENGDYLYGKRRLREIDRRLRFLDRRIRQAIVVEPGGAPDGAVRFGASVTYVRADDAARTVTILGVDEAVLERGEVSLASPIGRALLGRRPGDEVVLHRPGGRETIEVLAVVYGVQSPDATG